MKKAFLPRGSFPAKARSRRSILIAALCVVLALAVWGVFVWTGLLSRLISPVAPGLELVTGVNVLDALPPAFTPPNLEAAVKPYGITVLADAPAPPQNAPAPSEEYRAALETFSVESASLALTEKPRDKNYLYSPTSLYLALSLLTDCTAGDTNTELLSALQADAVPDFAAQSGALFARLYRKDGSIFPTSSVWISPELAPNPAFYQQLAGQQYATVLSADFTKPDTAKAIQAFTDKATFGLLSGIAPQVNSETITYLLNTLYFRSKWSNPFPFFGTVNEDFYLTGGGTSTATYMNQTLEDHYYAQKENYSASYLPFVNGCSMTLILPAEGTTPDELLADPELLRSALFQFPEQADVFFKIPKFEFSDGFDCIPIVSALEANKLFIPGVADFTPLVGEMPPLNPPFVSAIFQNTTITVDEYGAKAAAHTDVIVEGESAAAAPTFQLVLDRPFLFAITTAEHDILFLGVMNNPSV